MSLTLVTGPKKETITVEGVKAFVGLETDQDQFDALLEALIRSAESTFEVETNTKIMEQTWKQYLDDWPLEEDYIEIAYPPLSSITAIKYTDSGGSLNTWASSNYAVDINSKPGKVYLAYNGDWPTAVLTPASDAIEIEFVCGYENPDNVPYDIKNTLKLLVDFFFVNRGESEVKIPKSIMDMILKHKVYYL